MVEAGRKLSIAAWVWVVIAAMAIFELVAHPVIRASVPSEESWSEASSFVRDHFQPGERIVSAPPWIDPIVRQRLGDLLSLRAAAPPDDAGMTGTWEISIRGAATRSDPPELERTFGDVQVRMWRADTPELIYDFVEEIADASVELGDRVCPWGRGAPGLGGLERGPMRPAERFVCDRRRPWLWVGATVLNDLELTPRRCIWQHPAGAEPVRATFFDVPLGARLVVRGGVDYQVARRRAHPPVVLRVFVDDELKGQLEHRDADGWSGLDIDLSHIGRERGTVRFETTAADPRLRVFCYSASMQTAGGS